jgi:glutathione S-transferase
MAELKTMQLFYSPGSPFARKVRVLARERGVAGQMAEIALSPHDNAPELLSANPLGKVPALRTRNETLFDSPVICEYLDMLGGGVRLVPPDGPARIAALRTQALADGIMDAAVASVLERRRSDSDQSAHWLRRWRMAIERAVAALTPKQMSGRFDIAGISVACALAYLEYRMPEIVWRDAQPALAMWLDDVSARDSMLITRPAT